MYEMTLIIAYINKNKSIEGTFASNDVIMQIDTVVLGLKNSIS